MRVLIVGAGIGGLTAARALQQEGADVAVFEHAPRFAAVGAGITLWSNAIHALRRIGLGDAVVAAGGRMTTGEFRTQQGKVLSTSDQAQLESRFGAPAVCLHRAELVSILAESVTEGALNLNAACVGLSQDAQSVTVTLSDGRQERGDLLIGADGIHSFVRESLWGAFAPRYAGYVAWRGIAAFASDSLPIGLTCESWGCGQRFGIVPLSQTRVYWFATCNGREEESRRPELKSRLLAQFRDWHAPIPDLIEATEENAILQNAIYDRDPIVTWGKGRVTLLGDAAHPTTPNLGQGGCQAMEDAVVLAKRLRETAEIVTALREYERVRQERTAKITLLSRRFGNMGQWDNPLACQLRNTLMRWMPASQMQKQLEAILRFEG